MTVASANDVDTYPPLAYSFDEAYTDEEALAQFSIDRFSGKVLLKKPLDFERREEYQLKIFASDSKYKAHSTLTIHITDENDNAPMFSQLMYQSTISGEILEVEIHYLSGEYTGSLEILQNRWKIAFNFIKKENTKAIVNISVKSSSGIVEVLKVNATDMDSDKNAQQRYSLVKPVSGFYIGETTGIISANASQINKLTTNDVQFSVMATDSGIPALKSTAAVRVKIISNNLAKPQFIQNQYR